MRSVHRHLEVPLLAACLVLGGCSTASEPVAQLFEGTPRLSEVYVLQAVSGRALPARFLSFSERVYRVHADTLRFDVLASTFVEAALIGGRDTTTALAEAVAVRSNGPLPYEQRDVSTVLLANFLGLGRATATIHDDWLTVVALGQRFSYLRVR